MSLPVDVTVGFPGGTERAATVSSELFGCCVEQATARRHNSKRKEERITGRAPLKKFSLIFRASFIESCSKVQTSIPGSVKDFRFYPNALRIAGT